MIKELTKLASHLDQNGHRKEADYLDKIIRKMADEETSPEAAEVDRKIMLVQQWFDDFKQRNHPHWGKTKQMWESTSIKTLTRGLDIAVEGIPEWFIKEHEQDYSRDRATYEGQAQAELAEAMEREESEEESELIEGQDHETGPSKEQEDWSTWDGWWPR